MIYVDTSAAFKLMKPEVHFEALTHYLDARDDLVSSTLLAVELRRVRSGAHPARCPGSTCSLREST